MNMRQIWVLLAPVCLAATPALAQDPVKIGPQHYEVVIDKPRRGSYAFTMARTRNH